MKQSIPTTALKLVVEYAHFKHYRLGLADYTNGIYYFYAKNRTIKRTLGQIQTELAKEER